MDDFGSSFNYIECEVDMVIAKAVWGLLKTIEAYNGKLKKVSLCYGHEDGRSYIGLKEYQKGDEENDDTIIAIMNVDPSNYDDVSSSDEGLDKAIKFLYFYQAIHARLQKDDIVA